MNTLHKVFTKEVLEQLDENVIKPKFKFPDHSNNEDLLESLEENKLEENNEQE